MRAGRATGTSRTARCSWTARPGRQAARRRDVSPGLREPPALRTQDAARRRPLVAPNLQEGLVRRRRIRGHAIHPLARLRPDVSTGPQKRRPRVRRGDVGSAGRNASHGGGAGAPRPSPQEARNAAKGGGWRRGPPTGYRVEAKALPASGMTARIFATPADRWDSDGPYCAAVGRNGARHRRSRRAVAFVRPA